MTRSTQFSVGLLALAAGLFAFSSSPALGGAKRSASPAPPINPANFVAVIDNPFFPLRPGTTFYYEGEKDGLPASDIFEVTHRTRVILGITCVEVHDRAFENGVLAETTMDWFAQDVAGNVWYFGEDTKELDANGNVVSTEGTWLAGVNGALPGIVMEAHPHVGDRYAQEVAPGVAEDRAQVLKVDATATVPFGQFDDLLLTKETSPLDPGVVEHKYYAPGIGFIRGIIVKGGDEHTELVRITGPGGSN